MKEEKSKQMPRELGDIEPIYVPEQDVDYREEPIKKADVDLNNYVRYVKQFISDQYDQNNRDGLSRGTSITTSISEDDTGPDVPPEVTQIRPLLRYAFKSHISADALREDDLAVKEDEKLEEYVLVKWPKSGSLMDKPFFRECVLISDKLQSIKLGSSSYFVPKKYINKI